MGSTAGSSGLGLIVGVLEGAMGDLVGVRAFPGAADHDVVSGGRVNHRIFYQILALSLVRPYRALPHESGVWDFWRGFARARVRNFP